MADRYWRGANFAIWGTSTNWSADLAGTVASTVPTVSDTAYFVASNVSGSRTVYLNIITPLSVGGIIANQYSSSGVTILGGNTTSGTNVTLNVKSAVGISALSGAGPMTIGTTSAQRQVYIGFPDTAAFPITHSSSNDLFIANSFNPPGGRTVNITVNGTGTTTFFSGIECISTIGFVNVFGNTNGGSVYFRGLRQLSLAVNSGWAKLDPALNNLFIDVSGITMSGGKLSSSSTTGLAVSYNSVGIPITLSGTITLQDATNTGALTFPGTTTVAGTTTLTSLGPQSSNLVFSGVIGNNAGSAYTLTFTGTSDVVLNSASAGTFNGAVVFNATSFRTLYMAGFNSGTPNQLNGASSITINTDWQILGSGANTFTSSIGGTGIIYVRNTSASGITFNGSMASYTGSLRMYADSVEGASPVQKVTLTRADQFGFNSFWFQSGGGLTTLSQTLSYTGSDAVTNSKPLYIYGTSASPTTIFSNDTSSAGTLVAFSGIIQTLNAVTATFRVATINGPVTISGLISNPNSGVINFNKTGTYQATLLGANTFTGSVTVSAGTLNANSATALGLATSTAAISVTSGATLSLGAAVNYNTRTTSISGVGVPGIDAGCLVLANAGPLKLGAINATNNTYIRGTTDTLLTSDIAWSGGGGLRLGAATGTTATFSGTISVTSGTLTAIFFGRSNNPDLGTVALTTTNAFSARAQIDFGSLQINSDANLGVVPATATPEYLIIGNSASLSAVETFALNANRGIAVGPSSGTGTGTINVADSKTLSYAGVIANNSTGTGALTKAGGGSLTLSSAASTFSGGVTLTEGTLYAGAAQSGVSGPLGITGTITFSPAGTGVLAYTSASASFDYSSRFATTNGQSRRINVNGESVTFSTALGGTNELRLVGVAGTLTLGNVVNTYTQGTTLSVGTLKCNNAASLGTGGLAQANGTTLHVAGTGGKLTIQGAHTNTGTGSRTIRIGAA